MADIIPTPAVNMSYSHILAAQNKSALANPQYMNSSGQVGGSNSAFLCSTHKHCAPGGPIKADLTLTISQLRRGWSTVVFQVSSEVRHEI